MVRIVAFVCSAAAGSVGWWLGSMAGIMTGFLLSTVASGVGLYYGMRWGREFFE